ncbi:phosphocholine cytidylyltransferase family protein [Myxococcota bacterium]|nr:phosphocholine cytidylyltransferase family protein [Myxococcota bacterium]
MARIRRIWYETVKGVRVHLHAIILSAGQGRRLAPHTRDLPKCLLPVQGDRTVLEVQLRALRDGGITEARVMVGFEAEKVEAFLATRPVPEVEVETLFNPFFDSTDNLVTAWLARSEMRGEFLLMNGDTLFEPAVLRGLLSGPEAAITLVVNGKSHYDADDMKVSIAADGRLRAVSKLLVGGNVNGESIGLMRFGGDGIEAFRAGLDRAVRTQRGKRAYYLSVIDELSRDIDVRTSSMTGLWWGELDSPQDLQKLRADLDRRGDGLVDAADAAQKAPTALPARAPRERKTAAKRRSGANRVPAALVGGRGVQPGS